MVKIGGGLDIAAYILQTPKHDCVEVLRVVIDTFRQIFKTLGDRQLSL